MEDNISCAGIQDAHVDGNDITNTLPSRMNGIKEYSLSDETVLYTLEHETAHSLNSSAKAIWELCDGNNTVFEISQILGKRFGFSVAELLPDVIAVITKLQRLSLLELKDVPRTNQT